MTGAAWSLVPLAMVAVLILMVKRHLVHHLTMGLLGDGLVLRRRLLYRAGLKGDRRSHCLNAKAFEWKEHYAGERGKW